MSLKTVKELKEKLRSLYNNEDLSYFEDDDVFNNIRVSFKRLEQEYMRLYIKTHNETSKKLQDIQKKIDSSPTWKLIVKISEKNNQLKKWHQI